MYPTSWKLLFKVKELTNGHANFFGHQITSQVDFSPRHM
ncbi:hypothetical protein C358_05687 [Cryptococcus neoformans MW-RSA852]|nr:hypothetical protein C356_05645 [Cryptococcus neoformans var. grubii c45]OXC58869.1 hypothetical protein C358_05687 [Cryptococcus neoformans var. grubii MW-RSA852]